MEWNTISRLISLMIITAAFIIYVVCFINPKYVANISDALTEFDVSGRMTTKSPILYGVPMFIMIIGLVNECNRHYVLIQN
jgi:hypothetical protein